MTRQRIWRATIIAVACVALPWALAPYVTAQARRPPQRAAIPRMPDGKPNFNGNWQAMGKANWDLEPHSARSGLVVALGAIAAEPAGPGYVEGGRIPYLPAALAKRQENFDKRLSLDPEIKCYLPGVPRAMYLPHPFQIVQGPQQLFMGFEFASAMRTVLFNKQPPPPVDTWMGQSTGRWEGDTLVVEVVGQNGQSWLDRAGNFASEQLRVVERYTFITPDAIGYEATLEDPTVFNRPWKIRLPLYRRMEKDAQLMEFKCVEFVEELMYGHLRPLVPAK